MAMWVPEVREGIRLSRCAISRLGEFFRTVRSTEGGPEDHLLGSIRLHAGVPDIVKKHAVIEVRAFTYGNAVYLADNLDPANMDSFEGLALLAHEYVHSLQADKYGSAAIFGILYLEDSARQAIQGENSYSNNRFENQAEDLENSFRVWLETHHGRNNPCQRGAGGVW